ncbi:hypothetical protein AC1031_012630 [Aphanomyces cochlioides]|nr:hypothetical protein AC1031_012630 [Aphanomyces cochlioides]
MGRTCSLTEWAHFIKTTHKASTSYWWVYCRHCVTAAMHPSSSGTPSATSTSAATSSTTPTAKEIQEYVDKLPLPSSTTASEPNEALQALVGRRSVMKAHLAQCVHASPIPPNPIVKRRAGKRGVHCAIAEWAHFHRLDNQGYIGNTNYFPVVCKYCSEAYDAKTRPTPPDVFAGRKESMRRHLTLCQYFTGRLPEKKKPSTDAKSLSEWEFFIQLDRQPGSMYYFAKCKSCTEAHERNPEENPPPKIILGRKHNMQTHLANCEHMHHLRDVMEHIVFSSDDEGDMADDDNSSSATTAVLTPQDALVHFTIEYSLPFAWIDSPHMRAAFSLTTTSLPSAAELSTTILQRVEKNTEARQRAAAGGQPRTLVIEAVAVDGDLISCVAWLLHPNGAVLPHRLHDQQQLSWRCRTSELVAAVHARSIEDSLVAVLVPLPMPRIAADFPRLHVGTNVASIFRSIWKCILHDDMVLRVLRSATKLAPLPASCWADWTAWLHLVNQARPHYPLELDFWQQLDSVGLLLATLSQAHNLARTNTLSLAHTLDVLGQMYRQSQALSRTTLLQLKLEHELEVHWSSMDQPLFVLAYVLHPSFQGQTALDPRRSVFSWDEIVALACDYSVRWFDTDERLRSQMFAFASQSQWGTTLTTEEFIERVAATAPELARLMQRLLDIMPSFCLDGRSLPAQQYSLEEWQNIKYISHCQPPSERSDRADVGSGGGFHDVDAFLLKWRAQEPLDVVAGTTSGGGGDTDGNAKVTLASLFGGHFERLT